MVDPDGMEPSLPIDPITISVTPAVGTGVILGGAIYHSIKYTTDATQRKNTNSFWGGVVKSVKDGWNSLFNSKNKNETKDNNKTEENR